MIDVSILIPTYNRLWSLPQAVKSCGQTRLNIEIIVVDDGSTDGTNDWLAKQAGVIALYQENQGKDWAVNNAFERAKGKYVRFLDADDWTLPYSTDNLFDEAEKHNFDITCAGYQIFDEHENFIRETPWTVCDDFLAQQLGECDSSHYSAFLFKRDFIEDIPHRQEFGSVDDRQFIIECAIKNPKVGHIKSSALAHRAHHKNRLQSAKGLRQDANHLALLTIYKRCFEILDKRGLLSQRYKNAATDVLFNLAHWVAIKHLAEAGIIHKWVYELNPNFKPPRSGRMYYLYKYFGFKGAERLFKIGRFFKYGWQ